jgi:hypothetical protein
LGKYVKTMTGLTYSNRQEEQDDKVQQEKLLVALDAAPFQLRRDECGWWVIRGRYGSFQTWGDGKTWVAYVMCCSDRHWTITKRRLGFMKVTQDGDDEGCLRLFDLPTQERAAVIRDVLGLRKRRTLSKESRDKLIAAGVNRRFRAGARPEASGTGHPPPTNGNAPKQGPTTLFTPEEQISEEEVG